MNRNDLDLQCFCCTTLLDVIYMKQYFHEYYINILHSIKCKGVLSPPHYCMAFSFSSSTDVLQLYLYACCFEANVELHFEATRRS
jgi:hypothetical protein